MTGANGVWFFNGTTYLGLSFFQTQADLNWKILGTGDFDSDGHCDILWRNVSTGQNALWYMNGTPGYAEGCAWYGSSAPLNPCADLTWEIVGTAYLNLDASLDILWRNQASGANVVWFMSNATQLGATYLSGQSDLNWHIAGTGEFGAPTPPDSDGDGLPDSWEMQYFGNLSQNGSGDFDADGLVNVDEFAAGTDPTDLNTDHDRLSDGAEVMAAGTDPLNPDSNGDGVPDGDDLAWDYTPESHPFIWSAWTDEQVEGVTKGVSLLIPRGIDALYIRVQIMTEESPENFDDFNDTLSYSLTGPVVQGSQGSFTLTSLGPEPFVWRDVEGPSWWVCHDKTKDCGSYITLTVSATDGGDQYYPPIPSTPSVIRIVGGGIQVEMESPGPDEKRVFSSETPGVLQFDFRVPAPVDGVAVDYLRDHMRFTIDGIGDCALTWAYPDGTAYYDDENRIFRNTATFTGLPSTNDAFGEKQVRLHVDHWGLDTEWTNQVFYVADATNHPGVDPPAGQGIRPPNYFYYYMQTPAGSPTATMYGPFYSEYKISRTDTTPPYKYFAAYDLSERVAGKQVPMPGVNGHPTIKLKYIDLFAWSARHEHAHHTNWTRFWPEGISGRTGDTDPPNGDLLPDYEEYEMLATEGGPFEPILLDSHPNDGYVYGPATIPDCERHNCNSIHAMEWDVGSANRFDWAKPAWNWEE